MTYRKFPNGNTKRDKANENDNIFKEFPTLKCHQYRITIATYLHIRLHLSFQEKRKRKMY